MHTFLRVFKQQEDLPIWSMGPIQIDDTLGLDVSINHSLCKLTYRAHVYLRGKMHVACKTSHALYKGDKETVIHYIKAIKNTSGYLMARITLWG